MTKQILYAKLRATVAEFGKDATSKAVIVGPSRWFTNTAEGLFIDAPTVSVYTLANVDWKVARFFEDVEIDAETKGESKMEDEQKTPELPEGFEIVTEEYRRANEYPSGVGAMFFRFEGGVSCWLSSNGPMGWSDKYMCRYAFAIKAEQTPDIPAQVGAIAERCARISETTAHDVFFSIRVHIQKVEICFHIGGHNGKCGCNQRITYIDTAETFAAEANEWLDNVLTEAGASK